MSKLNKYLIFIFSITAIFLSIVFLQQFFIPVRYNFSLVAGDFGISPTSYSCIGISLNDKIASKLPDGQVEFQAIAKFAYNIDSQEDYKYCLGQNVEVVSKE